ncbi:stress-induced protein [Komagataeibacter medellinensis]|uniref:Stress-induced protein n=1 Tax=Komagataeibacter medellinensis TaxID=1177712 RepID=A0ABQ6VQZ1_9PROT|nr:general stress protein [Komagataeibacter medellinensis]KAB8122366.1 stress-induced protein [Komagataeibacter medellinensis]
MVYRLNQHERTSIVSLTPADSRSGGGTEHNPGNFANDRRKASEAGHKGGQHSSGNFAEDPQRAAGAGRKGSQHSHDHEKS